MDRLAVRRLLAADRHATLSRIAWMTADLEDLASASAGSNLDDEHDPEGSTVAFERQQLAASRARTADHLADIDAALDRLATDRYGVCERCGQNIGEDRLVVLPAARLCIACAAG
jgi:RNA polymerase-binding transcription factor DksA